VGRGRHFRVALDASLKHPPAPDADPSHCQHPLMPDYRLSSRKTLKCLRTAVSATEQHMGRPFGPFPATSPNTAGNQIHFRDYFRFHKSTSGLMSTSFASIFQLWWISRHFMLIYFCDVRGCDGGVRFLIGSDADLCHCRHKPLLDNRLASQSSAKCRKMSRVFCNAAAFRAVSRSFVTTSSFANLFPLLLCNFLITAYFSGFPAFPSTSVTTCSC